jgi:hypothetical protein
MRIEIDFIGRKVFLYVGVEDWDIPKSANDERKGEFDWMGLYWSARCSGRVTSMKGGDWMHVKSEDNDSTSFRDCN